MLRWLRGFVLPEAACLSEEDRFRYQILFEDLDRNGDGVVDIVELKEGLNYWSSSFGMSSEQEILKAADTNADSKISFEEFAQYLEDHELKMKLAFHSLDKNGDGVIDASEVVDAVKALGIDISEAEAKNVIKSMDIDDTMTLDWDEWKYYFLLHPATNINQIIRFWKRSMMVDIGESLAIPDEFTAHEKRTGIWWKRLVAAGIASAVARTFTAPFDRLKIMMQVYSLQTRRMRLISVFRQLVKEGGFLSLWRGNGMNIFKIAPETAIKIGSYEQVVKTRLTVGKTGEYSGVIDCCMKLFRKEGFQTFFKGYVPNMLGIVPYTSLDLAVYELLKNYWLEHFAQKSVNPGIMILLACSTLSHTCGQLASFPLHLLRTRMQVEAMVDKGKLPMTELIHEIYNKEGKKGFFRGFTPSILKVIPAIGIGCVAHETVKPLLGII
ncbi:mitochondrial adenyl nucleotide antiporter SLC25A24-like isoform X4 [Dipodomys merriami]|uniref:mitochondrial adenyl nucleotide antiporter SLC25A24-like isoform X4 n=1 Tax=Dipodomys merriami TaxID=94247 RepID=UPI003855EF8F